MPITLAHVSDVHLPPLPSHAMFGDFAPKRLIGGFNWVVRRQYHHVRSVADALAEDVRAQAPDHVAFTGDLVNLSAPAEFPQAAAWLQAFGTAEWISFVPGNHDAYVRLAWERGLAHFAPYMAGSLGIPDPVVSYFNAAPFPYVRFRGNVAIIGLTSALPQSLRRAGGSLGARQIALATQLLRDLKAKGCYRVILIHHPPMPGLTVERKALKDEDAEAFCAMIAAEGAELILHGHNHRSMKNHIETAWGQVPVMGVASASMIGDHGYEPSGWTFYEIDRRKGEWRTRAIWRRYDAAARQFNTIDDEILSGPP